MSLPGFLQGFSVLELALLAFLAYYIYAHGLPYVIAKAKSIWGSAEADFGKVVSVFQADIATLKADVEKAKTEIATIKTKLPG